MWYRTTDLAQRLFAVAMARQHVGVLGAHLLQLLVHLAQLAVAVLALGRLLLGRVRPSPSHRLVAGSLHVPDVGLQAPYHVVLLAHLSQPSSQVS